jgi:hypothetical protein
MLNKVLLCLLISINIVACKSSDSESNKEDLQGVSPPASTTLASLTISVLPHYLVDDEELFIYDLTNDGELVVQTSVVTKALNSTELNSGEMSNGETSTTELTVELAVGHIYKVVFNPQGNLIAIKCPLAKGCLAEVATEFQDETVPFGETLKTRLTMSIITTVEQAKQITITPITELAAKLLQSSYVDEITPENIKKTQSVLANTLGLIGYQHLFENTFEKSTVQQPTENIPASLVNHEHWNNWLSRALIAGILFDQRTLNINGNSRITSIYNRLYYTLVNNDNRMGEFNQFVLADADLFLRDFVFSKTPDATAEFLAKIARMRAYLLAKNSYPEKGYLPSPNIGKEALAQSKSFLDDFRSVLYSFQTDTPEYEQVNNAVRDGYQLIEAFSNNILVDLFPVFTDVLNAVPLGSDDGEYQLDELTINYLDNKLQWQITGQYEGLTLALTIKINRIQVNAITGNAFVFSAQGQLSTEAIRTELTDTKFSIQLNPAEDPFSGQTDGTGFIGITTQAQISQAQSNEQFTGTMDARITIHLNDDNQLLNTLESAAIVGELTNSSSHKLSLGIIHPNVEQEQSDELISKDVIAAVSYSAPVHGLGEPQLTLFVDYEEIADGLTVSNIDTIAYFEGRMAQFSFSGKSNNFTYQGINQDNTQWQIKVKKKVAEGDVRLNNEIQGTPRVLKDLPGIMFNDGNFISIF